MAIIYITHRLGEVPAVADRAVVLRDGANAGALARDELTHDNMIRLMVGRDIDVEHDAASAQRDGSELLPSRRAAHPALSAARRVVRRRPRRDSRHGRSGRRGPVGNGAGDLRRSSRRSPARSASTDSR